MSESVSIARLDDSRSTDSVVVVSADKDLQLLLQLFAISVICNYNYNYLQLYLILLIYCVVFLKFIFFVVRISKDPTHVTYHSLTSLINVKLLFFKGTQFQVTAFDELQWYSVQQSYITILQLQMVFRRVYSRFSCAFGYQPLPACLAGRQ